VLAIGRTENGFCGFPFRQLPEALRVTASSEARIIAAPSFPKG